MFGVKVDHKRWTNKITSMTKSVSSSFVAGTQNLFYFHLLLLKSDRELFRDFNDFALKCGKVIRYEKLYCVTF